MANDNLPERRVTLAGEGVAEFEEKKSVFIGRARPVSTEEEALAFIRSVKAEFSDARHNVWAYRLQGDISVRCSDDGEPQGSAGIPVLDAIRKSGVSDAAVVVTRYFGGILLGAGGLVRAYSHTAKLAIDAARIVVCEKCLLYEVSCSYSDYQRFLAELPKFGAAQEDSAFAEQVTFTYVLPAANADRLSDRFCEMSGGSVIPRRIGERFSAVN